MRRRITWLIVSGLLVAALLLSACGPAVTEKEKAEVEKEKEEVVVEKKAAEKFVWLDQGGWVRPEFVDDIEETAPGVFQVYPYTLEEPQYGGTLNIYSTADPRTFDPWQTNSCTSITHEQLYIGDFTLPDSVWDNTWATYQPISTKVGWLAEGWELPDPYTIIFNLKKGIKFNAGLAAGRAIVGDREMTADDVVYSYSRWIGLYGMPPSAADRTGQLFWDEVVALDKYTVRIHSTVIDTEIVFQASCKNGSVIYPHEIVDKYGDYGNWRVQVGTGAFIISDFIPGVSTTYIKNKEYWDTSAIYGEDYPLPFVDGIKDLLIADSSTQLSALRTGKIDMKSVEYEELGPLIRSNPELPWREGPVVPTSVYMRTDKWPTSQLKFRQALWMAINHQAMIDAFWDGRGFTGCWPFWKEHGATWIAPEDLPKEPRLKSIAEPVVVGRVGNTDMVQQDSTVSAYEIWNYSPENLTKARALLDDVLGPGGTYNLEIMTTAANTSNDRWEVIIEYWKKIGINAELKYVESAVNSALKSSQSYKDISLGGGGSYSYRIMGWYTWYGMEPVSAWNVCAIRDPVYDVMVRDILGTPRTEAEKDAKARELWLYLQESVLVPSIPSPIKYHFWQPWLKGSFRNNDGLCFATYGGAWRQIWIDRELKKFITGK